MKLHGTNPMASQLPQPSLLSIDTRRARLSFDTDDEPLSPVARLYQDIYILVVMGLSAPIDICDLRASLEATLVQHPRFCSIRVMTPNPRWVRTVVNLDDHVIVPGLKRTDTSANYDKLLEDYLTTLSTLPMDNSRPLWEVHVLDFPTSEAAASLVFRIHHAIGDGMSLTSLFVACAYNASDLKPRILLSSQPTRRKHPIGSLPPRPARSAGILAFLRWVLSCALFAWNSVMDFGCLLSMLFLGDPQTVFSGVKGVESRRKRFVSRNLSLDDVKHVKNLLNCTVNDVLLGVASVALSRYYFRKVGDHAGKKGCLCLRLAVLVNMRPTPALQVSGAVFHRVVSSITVTSSNVTGPVEQLELFGNKVVYIAPTIYGHPSALTIHWHSYMDTIRVVLAVDDEQFPDSHQLLDDFVEALKMIRDSL